MKKLLFTGIVILSMLVTNLKAQWVQVNGIYYGIVECFATIPNNSGGTYLFAATYNGGVSLSNDNGTTWTSASKGLNSNIFSLLAIGTNLYAGTGGGVFLSTDYGSNWTSVNTGLTNTFVSALAANGNNLFAGTAGGGVFLSTDNGTSWTAVNNGLTELYVSGLASVANGSGGTNLFAGTSDNEVFLSTNNGTSWTQYSSLPGLNVATLVSVPNGSGGTNLFAGTGNGVFLSTNNGTSWTACGVNGQGILSLAANGTNLIAGCYNGGVYLSTDNGTSWNLVYSGNGIIPVWCVAFFPNGAGGMNLMAGTSNGIFISTNNGTSWTMNNSGLSNLYVRRLIAAPDGTGGTNIYAGTGSNGMFVLDKDDTLTEINNGFVTTTFNIFSLASRTVSTDSAYIYAGVFDGWVYRTFNNGTSWTRSTSIDMVSYIKALAVSGTTLFAGATGNGVFSSTNDGTDWTEVSTGLTNNGILSLLVDGTNLFAGTQDGVFLSSNNGGSWTGVSTGLTDTWINALAVSGTNLFAADFGVFRSTDNGANWIKACPSFSLYTHALYVQGTNLFAGTNGTGVYLSTDNGTSWTAVNTGLPDGLSALSFAARQNSSGATILYIGTEAGIWARPLSGIMGIDEQGSCELLDLQQNYPNPFKTTTTIKYKVKEQSFVSLRIFDIMGTEVASLVNERKPKGDYTVEWNAHGNGSGIYFCKLQNGRNNEVKKMLLMK